MPSATRLRFKLFALVLPLVIVVSVLSGYNSFQQSYLGMRRLANRHLAFKAEQLRDFAFSEWEVVSKLGLGERPEYRAAIEKSISSYASSLLREDTELIAAIDGEGSLALAISRGPVPSATDGRAEAALEDGWFSGRLLGQNRVGVAFSFPPLGWRIAVSDLESSFFSELRAMRAALILINAAAVLALIVLLSFFLSYVVKPVERLSGAIRGISAAKNLSLRVPVESTDEIGALASDFNAMIARLEGNYAALVSSNESEIQARRAATQREEETITILGRVSDFRDEDTGQHLRRIGELSALFMGLLGQDAETRELLRRSAPLHDIGKIGIPDSILLKPGQLDPAEYGVIKRHTALGYELLKGAQGIFLAEGAIIALTHHERWDGTGYPRGLAGEKIPLSGRIVGILDVFDALVSKRCYKEAWTMQKAREYMEGQRGKQFDPGLIGVFIENFAAFRDLAEDIGLHSAEEV